MRAGGGGGCLVLSPSDFSQVTIRNCIEFVFPSENENSVGISQLAKLRKGQASAGMPQPSHLVSAPDPTHISQVEKHLAVI